MTQDPIYLFVLLIGGAVFLGEGLFSILGGQVARALLGFILGGGILGSVLYCNLLSSETNEEIWYLR